MPRYRRGAQEHPRSRVEQKEGVSTIPAIRVSRDNVVITIEIEASVDPPEASFYDAETNTWQ